MEKEEGAVANPEVPLEQSMEKQPLEVPDLGVTTDKAEPKELVMTPNDDNGKEEPRETPDENVEADEKKQEQEGGNSSEEAPMEEVKAENAQKEEVQTEGVNNGGKEEGAISKEEPVSVFEPKKRQIAKQQQQQKQPRKQQQQSKRRNDNQHGYVNTKPRMYGEKPNRKSKEDQSLPVQQQPEENQSQANPKGNQLKRELILTPMKRNRDNQVEKRPDEQREQHEKSSRPLPKGNASLEQQREPKARYQGHQKERLQIRYPGDVMKENQQQNLKAKQDRKQLQENQRRSGEREPREGENTREPREGRREREPRKGRNEREPREGENTRESREGRNEREPREGENEKELREREERQRQKEAHRRSRTRVRDGTGKPDENQERERHHRRRNSSPHPLDTARMEIARLERDSRVKEMKMPGYQYRRLSGRDLTENSEIILDKNTRTKTILVGPEVKKKSKHSRPLDTTETTYSATKWSRRLWWKENEKPSHS